MRHLIFLVSASVLVLSCNHERQWYQKPVIHSARWTVRWFDFILELPPDSDWYLKGMIFHGARAIRVA